MSTHQTPVDNYLRNRKHVPCFYQAIATRVEVWGNKNAVVTRAEKRVFPQLFWVQQTLIPLVFLQLDRNTENMFSISFRKFSDEKRKQLAYFYHQNVRIISARTIITSTAYGIEYYYKSKTHKSTLQTKYRDFRSLEAVSVLLFFRQLQTARRDMHNVC